MCKTVWQPCHSLPFHSHLRGGGKFLSTTTKKWSMSLITVQQFEQRSANTHSAELRFHSLSASAARVAAEEWTPGLWQVNLGESFDCSTKIPVFPTIECDASRAAINTPADSSTVWLLQVERAFSLHCQESGEEGEKNTHTHTCPQLSLCPIFAHLTLLAQNIRWWDFWFRLPRLNYKTIPEVPATWPYSLSIC